LTVRQRSAMEVPRLDTVDLERLGVAEDSTDPDDLVFKKVSDNGANIKKAWADDPERWLPCVDHTMELCTIPFTWTAKRRKGADGAELADAAAAKGSVQASFAKARGLVGYLHVSTIAESDFHACQRKCGLPEEKVDQDVRTRWRSSHAMADQLVYHKSAVLEMDKNPSYKDAGETWGKNKLNFTDWDHLEESGACLYEASDASQLLEGDKYITSSLVVPMTYKLMATSAASHPVKFRNREEDELNDAAVNPVKVAHDKLAPKVQAARDAYHEQLVDRFDTNLPLPAKKFYFIAALLDPRFKKLKFKHDGMLQDRRRREALKWLSEAFNAKYKGKVKAADTSEGNAAGRAASTDAPPSAHRKRRKVSAAQFFANSDSEAESSDEEAAVKDELKEYLELPQIKYKSEQDAMLWWLEHQKQFPNLEVMARQYLGCPATSATVERLFSKVGIAFSAKRKRSEAATLESLMFTEANLP